VINYILGVLKANLEEDKKIKDSLGGSYLLLTTLISIVNSSIISLINLFLNRAVRFLTLYECHETYTKFNLSVALKLILSMFINTALIPFFVNYNKEEWFVRSGLITDIFFNTIAICFISPLIYF